MKNRFSAKSFFLGKVTLVALMLFFATTFVEAQTVTFAQYNQKIGGQDFVFTNNQSSANFQTVSGGSPITFTYLNIANLPAELQGPQDAHVFITAPTTAPALTTAGNRTIQPFNSIFLIRIVRDTPAASGGGTRTVLLNASITPVGASNSELSGDEGARSAGYSASTPVQVVNYDSDFLSFSGTIDRDLSLSFSSITPVYSLGTGFLNSFNAAGTGTFASNPPPIFMVPSAAAVTISGRVLSPKGRGLANARVVLMESSGRILTARTNNFGYFRFEEAAAGDSVVISVKSKLYTYAPQVFSLTEELNELNFIPQ